MRPYKPGKLGLKDNNFSLAWKIILTFTFVCSIISIILIAVLIANLKASGDAFSSVIGNIMSNDFPTQIQNGMLAIVNMIDSETTSVRDLLIETPICKEYDKDNDWNEEGRDLTNNKHNKYKLLNLQRISQKCTINTHGRWYYNSTTDTLECQYLGSSGITVKDNLAYYTGYSGYISCYHLKSCTLIWEKTISEILGYPDDLLIPSLTSPTIFTLYNGLEGIIFGAIGSRRDILNKTTGLLEIITIPCITIALNRYTGDLLFQTEVGIGMNRDNFCEQRTAYSIYNDVAISGLDSSNDYFALGNQGYDYDVTFQGSAHALNITTGLLLWKTYFLDGPVNGYAGCYAGAGVSGSNPPLSPELRMVYIATKNLYNYTQEVSDCLSTGIGLQTQYDISNPVYTEVYHQCLDEAIGRNELVLHDSLVSINIYNGAIIWSSQGIGKRNDFGIDARTQGCRNGTSYQGNDDKTDGEWCIVGFPGPGFGYQEQPILYKIYTEWRVSVLSIGGTLYTFNALNGDPRWGQNVGTGSTFGSYGISFNPDLNYIFVTLSGTQQLSALYYEPLQDFTMLLSDNSSILCNSGLVMAVDSRSGDIIWQSLIPYSTLDSCVLNTDQTVEYFKNGLNLTSIDGNPSLSAVITTNQILMDSCLFINNPLQIPLIQGNPTTSSLYNYHYLFVPTLLGSVLIINADNGMCITDISCDNGGIFNGVTIVNDNLVFSCGGKDLMNSYILNGNKIIVTT